VKAILRGEIAVPGDKSLSHRALMLGALAQGRTVITNLSRCRDVRSTIACLRRLGVKIALTRGTAVVDGTGRYGLKRCRQPLNAGNSATTLRLLAGILAGQSFPSVLSGDASLRRRPMERVAAPLRLMGARVTTGPDGGAPVRIAGASLVPVRYSMPVASAQVKSAILLAALYADGRTLVREALASRNHTENLLPLFGAEVAASGGWIAVRGGRELRPAALAIPGDFSAAAPWIAAACILPGSRVRITNVMLNPTRTGLLRCLKRMGARIRVTKTGGGAEPYGIIEAGYSPLNGADVSPEEVPSLIDEIPLLMVAATQARGVTRIRGAEELRHKESDRIDRMRELLTRMGAGVIGLRDGVIVRGRQSLRGASVDAGKDHRIVIAAAVAGMIAQGPVRIKDADCVAVSYPGFFRDQEALCSRQKK